MTDIVERLRADGALAGHYDVPAGQRVAADEIERLRAECQRLAGEVGRAHKDALGWMERAAAARREGIEAAMVACGAVFTDTEGVWANGFTRGVAEAQASIRALQEDKR